MPAKLSTKPGGGIFISSRLVRNVNEYHAIHGMIHRCCWPGLVIFCSIPVSHHASLCKRFIVWEPRVPKIGSLNYLILDVPIDLLTHVCLYHKFRQTALHIVRYEKKLGNWRSTIGFAKDCPTPNMTTWQAETHRQCPTREPPMESSSSANPMGPDRKSRITLDGVMETSSIHVCFSTAALDGRRVHPRTWWCFAA